MSHLASSDDPASPQNAEQLRRFRTALAMLPPAPASLSSSGGILLGPEYAFDMVRPGIALYGGNPCPTRPNPFAVAAVLSGRILQRRRIDKGEPVGYAATYRSARTLLLSTADVGYADGLLRAGSNNYTAPGGEKVLGRISMDNISMDSDKEELCIFNDASSYATSCGTISYEILVGMNHFIKRSII